MKAKRQRLLGEIILAASFLSQVLLFDYFRDESDGLDRAFSNQSLMDKGADLKELKYFEINFPYDTTFSNAYRKRNISLAAQKLATAQFMAILSSNKSKKEKTEIANKIWQKASSVTDFPSYQSFINYTLENSVTSQDVLDRIEEIEKWKTISRYLFICLYIIGVGLITYSFKFEKD
jgi:hypothetical protein